MITYRNVKFTLLAIVAFTPILHLNAAEAPWRLNEALGVGNGFSLSGSHRTRFENVGENVRSGTSINDQILTFRTILNAEYQQDRFSAQLELKDSRQKLADPDSLISTGNINTLDFLQANVSYAFGANGNSEFKFGRFTADGGSRRLLARNRYRNTMNAFEGFLPALLAGRRYRQLGKDQVT